MLRYFSANVPKKKYSAVALITFAQNTSMSYYGDVKLLLRAKKKQLSISIIDVKNVIYFTFKVK